MTDAEDMAAMLRPVCECDCGCGNPADNPGDRCPMCFEACGPANRGDGNGDHRSECSGCEECDMRDVLLSYLPAAPAEEPTK